MFGLVAFQAKIAADQQRLDRVEQEMSDAQATYERLRLAVAQLESPQTVISAAEDKGMVVPDKVTYVTPSMADVLAVALAEGRSPAPAERATTGDTTLGLGGGEADRRRHAVTTTLTRRRRPPPRPPTAGAVPHPSVWKAGPPAPPPARAVRRLHAADDRRGRRASACCRPSTSSGWPPRARASACRTSRSPRRAAPSSIATASSWRCRSRRRTLWADPRAVVDKAGTAAALANALGLDAGADRPTCSSGWRATRSSSTSPARSTTPPPRRWPT